MKACIANMFKIRSRRFILYVEHPKNVLRYVQVYHNCTKRFCVYVNRGITIEPKFGCTNVKMHITLQLLRLNIFHDLSPFTHQFIICNWPIRSTVPSISYMILELVVNRVSCKMIWKKKFQGILKCHWVGFLSLVEINRIFVYLNIIQKLMHCQGPNA